MASKFASRLAEELYDYTSESLQDGDLGDSETFGWFALFREEGAILSVDSQGFVAAETLRDVEAAWRKLSDRWAWFQLDQLDESCDGLFLILDTARHAGCVPDSEEIFYHISQCPRCQALGNHLDA